MKKNLKTKHRKLRLFKMKNLKIFSEIYGLIMQMGWLTCMHMAWLKRLISLELDNSLFMLIIKTNTMVI